MPNSSPLEGAKQDTIGVTKGTNVKQPHHRGPLLIFLMENKKPFIHCVVER